MNLATLPHANAALAIFPSVDGFGWALFEGPVVLVRSGVCMLAKKAGFKNARCLRRVEQLFEELKPGQIVLEEFEGARSRRSKRIRELCRSIIAFAATEGVSVRIISRAQISACFKSTPANTRYQVASIVARYVVEIRHLLPRRRKAWEGEFPEMARFAAAALLIVHYANPMEPL